MHAAALARAQDAAEVVRILYAVEDYEKRLFSARLRDRKNVVERRILEVDRIADTALMVRAVRLAVERRAPDELIRDAGAPCKPDYLRYAIVVRAARQYVDAVERAAAFKPFENGVFAVYLDLYFPPKPPKSRFVPKFICSFSCSCRALRTSRRGGLLPRRRARTTLRPRDTRRADTRDRNP